MKSHTEYLVINISERRAFVHVTHDVPQAVQKSGVLIKVIGE